MNELFAMIRKARQELAEKGFNHQQIRSLMIGDGVSIEAETVTKANEMVAHFQSLGFDAHAWTSGGGHGYEDKEMVTVRI